MLNGDKIRDGSDGGGGRMTQRCALRPSGRCLRQRFLAAALSDLELAPGMSLLDKRDALSHPSPTTITPVAYLIPAKHSALYLSVREG